MSPVSAFVSPQFHVVLTMISAGHNASLHIGASFSKTHVTWQQTKKDLSNDWETVLAPHSHCLCVPESSAAALVPNTSQARNKDFLSLPSAPANKGAMEKCPPKREKCLSKREFPLTTKMFGVLGPICCQQILLIHLLCEFHQILLHCCTRDYLVLQTVCKTLLLRLLHLHRFAIRPSF